MRTLIATIAGAAAFLVAASASAQDLGISADDFYGEASLTSDYRFRGVSLTQNDPSIGGELGFDNGFLYGGVGGNSINVTPFESTSLELFGFAGVHFNQDFGNTSLGFDFGVEYTDFYGGPSWLPDLDYWELHAGATTSILFLDVGGTISYSPDFIGGSGDSWTYEGNAGFTVWDDYNVRVGGTVGQTSIDQAPAPFDDWMYYSVGLSAEVWGFDVSAEWVDTDIETNMVPTMFTDSVDGGLVFTISRSF